MFGKILPRCFAILCCLFAHAAPAADVTVLRFATYASERPSEELKKIEPFHLYLEQTLAAQGLTADIRMRIYPSYDEAIAAVVNGETDFARLGPVSYVIAKKRNPRIRLLAMESKHGKKEFNGVILVAANSPMQTLSDLRGKRFAFGEANSTTGRYLAQEALVRAGIRARDLAEYDFVGRHDKVAFAVAAGNYDAGAVNETTLDKYGQEKGLRQLASFISPTHAWAARAGLDPKLARHLRQALLAMQSDALEYIGRDGFLAASDGDFDRLRGSMRRAAAFDE